MEKAGAVRQEMPRVSGQGGTVDIDGDQVKFEACREVTTSFQVSDCYRDAGFSECFPSGMSIAHNRICAFGATPEAAAAGAEANVWETVTQLVGKKHVLKGVGPMEIESVVGFWNRVGQIVEEGLGYFRDDTATMGVISPKNYIPGR
jgi:hypothetical protein